METIVSAADSAFRWLVGMGDGRSSYALTRWVFLRALGVIYLIAFVSLWVQVKGLIGSQGILPAPQYLQSLRGYLGPERYRLVPTRANGSPAFGAYVQAPDGSHRATGLFTITPAGDRICALSRFETGDLAWFGLPLSLPQP